MCLLFIIYYCAILYDCVMQYTCGIVFLCIKYLVHEHEHMHARHVDIVKVACMKWFWERENVLFGIGHHQPVLCCVDICASSGMTSMRDQREQAGGVSLGVQGGWSTSTAPLRWWVADVGWLSCGIKGNRQGACPLGSRKDEPHECTNHILANWYWLYYELMTHVGVWWREPSS